MKLRDEMLGRYGSRYDEIWSRIERGLETTDDALWLMGASSYIFSTGGVRWAVDPMFNTPRSGASLEQLGRRAEALLNTLSFALVTHGHADHFDTRLMRRCPRLRWFVPDHLAEKVPPECEKTVVRAGDVLELDGVRITAFDSLHYDAGTDVGVPETGYFAEAGSFRLLFPGDVRDYDAARLPRFGDVSHLFLHVWLGRRNALNWPCGDYAAQMARFALAFAPETVYLAHLLEAAREPDDLWTFAHAGQVADELLALDPALNVRAPLPGRTVRLAD